MKMHEPKVVTPVAAPCADEMLKAGEADVLVNATVVAPVVPKAATPGAKAKDWFTTAAVVVELAAGELLICEMRAAAGDEPPPPHAERTPLKRAKEIRLKTVFMCDRFLSKKYLVVKSKRNVRNMNK